MNINWSIVAGAAGFAAMRAAMFEYHAWKARRTEIPLDFNRRTGVYEPDLKLKRWEKAGRIAAWAAYGAICVLGYYAVTTGFGGY